MPTRPGRNCTKPGCSGTIQNGVCSACGPKKASNWRKADDSHLSASQRGYGANWRKLRAAYIAEHPLCEECQRYGRVTATAEVDHIVPKHLGGTDDWDNLQSLCRDCHKRKTAGDSNAVKSGLRPSTIPCTIVGGAPGSGKTTYVREHMLEGDVVLDLDGLYVALSGGLPWYDKPIGLLPFVCEARDAVLARLSRPSQVRHAWVITGEPSKRKLRGMASELGATLLVLDTDPLECVRRIANDERRSKYLDAWKRMVFDWWQTFDSEE